VNRQISDRAWRALSARLGIEEPTLKAIAEVESAGSGFLPPPDEEPRILFEGHAFHRLTKGQFAADHPDLSYPKWTKKFYARTPKGEWDRLRRARALDRDAANQATSWGAFQIMGFNYGLCGFSSVEEMVAAHSAGADQQLEAFAVFIGREPFLSALKNRDWAKFASLYNGPAYAKNRYHIRMAQAYAKLTGTARVARRRVAKGAKKVAPLYIGRPEFAPPPAGSPRAAIVRPVKPDAVDLRDWVYHPTIARAPKPTLFPNDPRPTMDQEDSSACTGFALAKVIEYLLERADRPVEQISGYMLYSMARRYDEWTGNDESDEGSSLRGALKGWARHGASAERLWSTLEAPPPTNDENDWWLDSVKRPLGAYYRLTLDAIGDIHTALMESGAVYASALTHGGWDELFVEQEQPAPTSIDQIPIIDCRPGEKDGGHAFAIVGYTDKGFIIQNSWGTKWGRGGFAVLTYADWRQNAMDAWVVQLGVVTREHNEVANASTLRVADDRSGRVVLSSSPRLASHEISPFVVNMQNEGRLSDRGQFRTYESDLEFLLDHHLNKEARERWNIGRNDTVDIALYAHGGLVDEESAAASARQWVPLLYSNRIFPIFLMWETDLLSTVFNSFEDAFEGEERRIAAEWWSRFKTKVEDWKDERIEGLARAPGRLLWRQMNDNANDISATGVSGVVKLFEMFKAKQRKLPRVRLHLIGHSAGAIVHSYLGQRAIDRRFEVASVNLIAPAVRVSTFNEHLGDRIGRLGIRTLVAHLHDDAERSDPTCSPYGKSLLYLVSQSFEEQVDEPLLGMEKHLVPAIVSHDWGMHITRLASPGAAYRPGDRLTVATTHGGLDDDVAVQEAVIRHIKGPKFAGQVHWPSQVTARDGEVPAERRDRRDLEARVMTRVAQRPRAR
jgi:hypothetical protein